MSVYIYLLRVEKTHTHTQAFFFEKCNSSNRSFESGIIRSGVDIYEKIYINILQQNQKQATKNYDFSSLFLQFIVFQIEQHNYNPTRLYVGILDGCK